jgi:hypothetical protein
MIAELWLTTSLVKRKNPIEINPKIEKPNASGKMDSA